MWLRNLLFLALIVGAMATVGGNLIPPELSLKHDYHNPLYHSAEFQSTVRTVDDSFRQSWTTAHLEPVAPTSHLAIARRLALGLMGTVPSLEEIRQLEALPEDQQLPWWIDHVLADRRTADYLAERLARAYVGTEDGPFILYRRRRFVSWLADQLTAQRPYDSLVRELITARGLWTDHPATNFLTVTAQQDKQNHPNPERLAGRVTRAFLGLRLDCAQCHNHPFAEWKQAQFHGFVAFFAQAHIGLTGVQDGSGEYQPEDRRTKEHKVVYAAVPFASELLPDNGTRRERLAAWVTSEKNPYFAKATVNRIWALLLGRPLAEPVDNLETDSAPPAALKILADDFANHHFDLQRLIRIIASTEVFRLDSKSEQRELSESDEQLWTVFPLTRLRSEQVAGSALQAASVRTIDADSDFLTRLGRFGKQNDFIKRYGDSGEDDFEGRGGTIPQRLLMMNGSLIQEEIREQMPNASTRIAWQASDDEHAIELAYLAVLTRRPAREEADYFQKYLATSKLKRTQQLEDIFWTLLNATEFSWNH
jgi:Protein of unknown function (DUF1549)/Protein of unknown function (DUF1553)